ncbi:MAG TPA: hypothetical protein VKQ11_22900 [Candidatus Sulfotelmatobacter sp.]|nr:hypothetical protein [Candidatus Sulfotelmatobacter sp.]
MGISHPLEGSRNIFWAGCRPSSLDGEKEPEFDLLHTIFAKSVRSILYVCLAAFQATIVIEVKFHPVAMLKRQQPFDCKCRLLRQKPRLEKNIVEKLFVFFGHRILAPRVETPKSRSHGSVADSGVDLSRGQVRVSEQLLNCPNIRSSFQKVSGKTVADHVGADCANSRSSSEFSHYRAQATPMHWTIPLVADKINVHEEFPESSLRGSVGHFGTVPQTLGVFRPAFLTRPIILPASNPRGPAIRDITLLRVNLVFEQIARPAAI